MPSSFAIKARFLCRYSFFRMEGYGIEEWAWQLTGPPFIRIFLERLLGVRVTSRELLTAENQSRKCKINSDVGMGSKMSKLTNLFSLQLNDILVCVPHSAGIHWKPAPRHKSLLMLSEEALLGIFVVFVLIEWFFFVRFHLILFFFYFNFMIVCDVRKNNKCIFFFSLICQNARSTFGKVTFDKV